MSGSISGTVIFKEAREQRAQLVLQLSREGGGSRKLVSETQIDASGRFSFTSLEPGSYTIAMKLDGDEPLAGDASVAELRDEEKRVISLEAERRYFISGTLLEERSGRPVGDLPLELVRHDRNWRERSEELAKTGEDGRFRSSAPMPAGEVSLAVREGTVNLTDGPDGLLLHRLAVGSEPATGLTLTFPWTGAVKGIVLDSHGHPVPGATVTAVNPNRHYETDETDGTKRTITAVDGTFFLDRLPADLPLVVEVEAAGLARTISEPFEATPAERLAEIVVRPSRPAHLLVRVVDEDGAPVPGAYIFTYKVNPELLAAMTRRPTRDEPSTSKVSLGASLKSAAWLKSGTFSGRRRVPSPVTREDGTLDLELAPGTYLVTGMTRMPRLDRERITATLIEDETTSLTITLERGVSVSGVVLTREGLPAPFAHISLSRQSTSGTCGHANERGEFTLDGVPRNHSIYAHVEGFYSAEVKVDAPLAGVQLVCSIPLNPPSHPKIVVSVVEEATKRPIPTASILVVSSSHGQAWIGMHTSNAEGTVSADCGVGHHEIFAGKRGYAMASTRAHASGSATEVRVELCLPRGQSVHGRVVDASGFPMQAVRVAVLAADRCPLVATAVLTSADGSFIIDSLPLAGASIGVIGKPGSADAITSVTPGQRNVLLTCER